MKFSLTSCLILSLIASVASDFDFATRHITELENMFVEDCNARYEPHGFYSAYLQPCEFSFFDASRIAEEDSCSDDKSKLLGNPTAVHWLFKLAEHFDSSDSSSSSWSSDSWDTEDFPDFDDLMLWPDQCVAVTPRCYALNQNGAIDDALEKLFPSDDQQDSLDYSPSSTSTSSSIPNGATHVRVDCRADAMELSRVVYSAADGFEKSAPTLVAWMVTLLLVSLIAMMWCCYGCFRLCFGNNKIEHKGYTKSYDDEECIISPSNFCVCNAKTDNDYVRVGDVELEKLVSK